MVEEIRKQMTDEVKSEVNELALKIRGAILSGLDENGHPPTGEAANTYRDNLRQAVDSHPKNGKLDDIENSALGKAMGSIYSSGKNLEPIVNSLESKDHKGIFGLGLGSDGSGVRELHVFASSFAEEGAYPTLPAIKSKGNERQ